MVITEVRIKLFAENSERLLAFCSITIDDAFVIRDLKLIDGIRGMFVAMPSRKIADHCPGPKCGVKNHLRARFCSNCGKRLDENRAKRDENGHAKLYADIAHPITVSCREAIQAVILKAFQVEKERAAHAGYVCTYDRYASEDDPAPSYGDVIRKAEDRHV